MESEPLACFCDGGNAIAAAKPGEACVSFQSELKSEFTRCWHGGVGVGGGEWCHRNGSEVNPLEVAGRLKEGRIRLAVECNQCDCIAEYDERGRKRRKEWRNVWKAALSAPKSGESIHNHNVNYLKNRARRWIKMPLYEAIYNPFPLFLSCALILQKKNQIILMLKMENAQSANIMEIYMTLKETIASDHRNR